MPTSTTPQAAPAAQSLSPATESVLRGIAEPVLRGHVETTVRYAIGALDALAQLHLPQDDFEAHVAREVDADWHLRLAPQTMASLAAINKLLAHVMATFDAPAELHPEQASHAAPELEFDTAEGQAAAAAKAAPASKAAQILQPCQQVAESAHLLCAMLRTRVVGFGERLQQATQATDTWPLLAELDDSKHQLGKAVQGVLFGVLGVFDPEAPREAIWPAYRSAVQEAVDLRTALTALARQMHSFAEAAAAPGGTEQLTLLREMADTLSHFSILEAYRSLRASDKKAVIEFRQTLLALQQVGQGPQAHKTFAEAMADFQTFLGAMYAINHREVLLLHDRQVLERTVMRLDACAEQLRLMPHHASQAQSELDAIAQSLTPLEGRSAELDAARMNWADVPPADATGLLRHIRTWQELVTPILVGMA